MLKKPMGPRQLAETHSCSQTTSTSITPSEVQARGYIICFAALAFIDLSTIVYEQYLLVSGRYSAYHIIRMIEYATTTIILVARGKLLPISIITCILIAIKIFIIFIHLVLRARARSQTEPPISPPVPTPTFPTPPCSPPTANTPKPTSSHAPTQRGEMGGGV
jgi:hypothetical protein